MFAGLLLLPIPKAYNVLYTLKCITLSLLDPETLCLCWHCPLQVLSTHWGWGLSSARLMIWVHKWTLHSTNWVPWGDLRPAGWCGVMLHPQGPALSALASLGPTLLLPDIIVETSNNNTSSPRKHATFTQQTFVVWYLVKSPRIPIVPAPCAANTKTTRYGYSHANARGYTKKLWKWSQHQNTIWPLCGKFELACWWDRLIRLMCLKASDRNLCHIQI